MTTRDMLRLSMLVAAPGAGHAAEAWWAAFRVSIVMSLTIGFAVRIALAIGDATFGRVRFCNAPRSSPQGDGDKRPASHRQSALPESAKPSMAEK